MYYTVIIEPSEPDVRAYYEIVCADSVEEVVDKIIEYADKLDKNKGTEDELVYKLDVSETRYYIDAKRKSEELYTTIAIVLKPCPTPERTILNDMMFTGLFD